MATTLFTEMAGDIPCPHPSELLDDQAEGNGQDWAEQRTGSQGRRASCLGEGEG